MSSTSRIRHTALRSISRVHQAERREAAPAAAAEVVAASDWDVLLADSPDCGDAYEP